MPFQLPFSTLSDTTSIMSPLSVLLTNPQIVAVGAGVFSLLLLFWIRYRKVLEERKPFEEMPMPPKSHWFFGHLLQMKGDFQEPFKMMNRDHCNEFGQTGYWFVSRKIVAVTAYQDARTVLNNSNHRTPLKIFRRHVNRFLGPRNIGFLSGKEWKFHRSSILRTFAPSMVNDAKPAILKVVSTFLASLKNIEQKGQSIPQQDIGALMKMITIDIFGQTALSHDLGCCMKLEPSNIATAFDYMGLELSKRMMRPFSLTDQIYSIPTERNIRQKRERQVVRSFLEGLVSKRLTMPDPQRPQDLLTHLLRGLEANRDEAVSEEDLSESAISDILMGLLFAGYDTTSLTLTYALYHCATMPESEKKCLDEIRMADPTDPDTLQYCRAFVLETLRLYPPGSATTRTTQKPLTLQGGFVVPKDTVCFVPIWTIQRMEEHFERPDEFNPERWVHQDTNGMWRERKDEAGEIAPANRKAFFAFSGGARSCAAMNFAMTEAVLVFAQLVQHLTFKLPPNYELHPIRVGLVVCPRDKMIMTMKWRESQQNGEQ